jgi:hypothetical protein
MVSPIIWRGFLKKNLGHVMWKKLREIFDIFTYPLEQLWVRYGLTVVLIIVSGLQ